MADENAQQSLLDWRPRPPAVRGCDTSEAAAESMRPYVGPLQRRVLVLIRNAGPGGATCDELEAVTELRHQTCSARVRELVLGGYVEDSGDRRKTRSGRKARVYVCTERGRVI